MKYPKILLIGANGQLGREFSEVLQRKRADLGDIPQEFFNAQITPVDVAELDVTNESQVNCRLSEGYDYVINCSAYTAVDKAESDVDKCYAVNTAAVKYLAEACEKFHSVLVHFSTDYVYGGDKDRPYTEEDECFPQNVYGKSKLEGENAIKSSCGKYFIFRTAWLYGKYGGNFVYKMLELAKRGSVSVVCDQEGTPTYANDLVYNVLRVIVTRRYGVYNCSGNGRCSWYEFAEKIFAIAGVNVTLLPVYGDAYKTAAKRPRYSVLENAGLKRLGLDFMREWQIALQSFLDDIK